MIHESSSATGTCPYPDCGAVVSLGKKFCKACGRPIQSATAPPASVAEVPIAPSPEPMAPAGPEAMADSPDSHRPEPNIVPPSQPVTEGHPPTPDTTRVPPQPLTPGAGNRRLLVVAGVGFILIAALGYWFIKPKPSPVAVLTPQAQGHVAVSTSIPSPTPPPQAPPAPAATAIGEGRRPQQDDALRGERESLAAERAKLEQLQHEAREQEQRRKLDAGQRQQESEAQQRTIAELKAKQDEQQRQIDEVNRKREEEAKLPRVPPPPTPTPTSIPPPRPEYSGPRFGEIVWEGTLKGTDLITVENGQASSGTVTGRLPGVAVLIQPTDTKKVSIASTPSPRNQYRSVVFRVSGNGNTRVTLKWSLP